MKELGSGGFGQVVLARHDGSGTLVAIKYLRRELLADPEFAEMFRAEAAVLGALEDPNVVRLYEYVESTAGAAIVMELIGGVSLREIIAYQGHTSAEAALVVLEGSLLGLAAAHRGGVVHRDYKPENVLVNGDGISKLTDFGIAARSGQRALPAGTLHYAAPEQMTGAPVTPASDVYAATATFYECLTGRPPFDGNEGELLYQHQHAPVPLEPVPSALHPLVTAGMAKNPWQRPADATGFVAGLQSIAAGAYGPDWRERGRSHLAEAALLLAALWPAGPPPAGQGYTVHRIWLRRWPPLRRLSAASVAIGIAALIAAAAAATALTLPTDSAFRTSATPTPAHSVSLQPPPPSASASPSPTSSPSTPSPSPSPSVTPAPPVSAGSTLPPPISPPPTSPPPSSPPPTSPPPKSPPPSSPPPSSPPPSSPPPSSPPPSSPPPSSPPPSSPPPPGFG
jgi:serine/threonine-protein kinase